MGNQAPVYARFIGEKKQGETRTLRNSNIQDGEDLVSTFRGLQSISEIFT